MFEKLTVDLVMMLLSGFLSLLFAYFPGLKNWFECLDPVYKPLLNLAVITVIVFGYAGVSAGTWSAFVAGLPETFLLWVGCLVANSQAYERLVKQPKLKARARRQAAAEPV